MQTRNEYRKYHGNNHTRSHTPDFIPYVGEFEFAEDTVWGACVINLAARVGDYRALNCPEPSLRLDNRRPIRGSQIRLGSAMYTADQLGKLDGPGRYHRKPDPVCIRALTPLASCTKRQRRKIRKLRRKAIREGEPMTTVELLAVVTG